MYHNFKKIAKKVIPNSLIKNNEVAIRKVVSVFYVGKKYACNICGFKMSKFISIGKSDKLCAKCGSRSRTRRLWWFLENKIDDKTILHFSPSNGIKSKLELLKNVDYITTDYAGEFNAVKKLNIEAIEEPDNTYDIVICYHVLEHIENDIKAMKELFRITKPNGFCLIQTPFKTGDIYEDPTVKTEADRLKHFGQEDHVRIYSSEGLKQRLQSVGFNVEINEFSSDEFNIHGFSTTEIILVASKK